MTTDTYPSTLELHIDAMAQGGDGVGRWQGRVVFVSGALPGETVRVQIGERRASFARGQAVEIFNPAPERVAPRLAEAAHAPWQHIAYPAQLRFKEQIVREQLAKLAKISDPPMLPIIGADHPWGYRNTAQLHAEGGKLGYYAADSHSVVDLRADPLLLPVLNEALAGLRAVLEGGQQTTKGEPQATRNDGQSTVDGTSVDGTSQAAKTSVAYRGKSTGHRPPAIIQAPPAIVQASPSFVLTGVTLRASERYGYAIAALEGSGDIGLLAARWLAQVPSLAAVQVQLSGADLADDDEDDEDAELGEQDQPLEEGADGVALHEELGAIVFSLNIESFFQVHTAQAERLLELVRAGLDLQPGERLLDAYGGVGTFGLPLSAGLREVVVIEESPFAVADGERSATLNDISNVRFISGAVERVLPTLTGPFDAAVLDPPRRGCHPAALAALIALAPRRVAYISCHPGILARDLGPLLAAGYQLRSVQPIDLFPQTPHIECIVLLDRQQ